MRAGPDDRAVPAGMERMTRAARHAWRALRGRDGDGAPPPLLAPREAYDLWAPTYDRPFTHLQELETRARAQLLPEVTGARVLDVGCGAGRVGREILDRGASGVVGVDFSRAMLTRARGGHGPDRLEWVGGHAAWLPFADGAFDVVISALVVGHLPEPAPALAEMTRVLRVGGALMVSDFHPRAARRGWERTFTDRSSGQTYRVEQTPHSPEELARILEALGLRVVGGAEKRYRGTPVVFALSAVRSGGRPVPLPGPGR